MKEAIMLARLVFISLAAALILAVRTAPAAAMPITSDEVSPESVSCALPSLSLLLPNDAGSFSGTVSSFTAGSRVFAGWTLDYLNCVSARTQYYIDIASRKISSAAHAGIDALQKKTAPRQPNAPAK